MTTILRINASARGTRSLTRELSTLFVARWRDVEPGVRIINRDVGTTPPSFISEAWISAAFTPAEKRTDEQRALLRESDELIDEVAEADVIAIASPMYNYGMPAHLKAWVDQVVRINRTFTFDLARGDQPLEPILNGKTLVLLTSCGEFAFGPSQANEHANHLTPHLKTVSKYLGASAIHYIGIEYQEFKDPRFEASKSAALAAVPELVLKLTARWPCAARQLMPCGLQKVIGCFNGPSVLYQKNIRASPT